MIIFVFILVSYEAKLLKQINQPCHFKPCEILITSLTIILYTDNTNTDMDGLQDE